ncbi:conserved hypothetical protein [Microsporum canis CBS 113480]|uniref:Uncharacterized protein n=1 Tax=Arthroderma otae (strain ATCC MYA-4605 / CBS 113480) TaxID=554155 RepID=C5FZS1_ARTOC|nr:conserved hypothetical protein [Microsporum canis CBS 113480]EEQ35374.1 conserved hypothetical protein [Microsporum canis CBS 113480]
MLLLQAAVPNPHRHTDRTIAKVDRKAGQLRMMGLTIHDQELLASRLDFVWGEPKSDSTGASQTAWRKSRARRAYTKIQEASDHLFLSIVLAIPPTECAQKAFDRVVEHFLRLDNYEQYRMGLDARAKRFFESTAAAKGFASSRHYLCFMQALFPEREERREYNIFIY